MSAVSSLPDITMKINYTADVIYPFRLTGTSCAVYFAKANFVHIDNVKIISVLVYYKF